MNVLDYIRDLVYKQRRGLREHDLADIRQECAVELLCDERSPFSHQNPPPQRLSLESLLAELPAEIIEEITRFLNRVIGTRRRRIVRYKARMRARTDSGLPGRDDSDRRIELKDGFDSVREYAKAIGQFEEDVILVSAQVHPVYQSFADLTESHQDWSRSKCYLKRRQLFDQLKRQLGPAWDERHDNC